MIPECRRKEGLALFSSLKSGSAKSFHVGHTFLVVITPVCVVCHERISFSKSFIDMYLSVDDVAVSLKHHLSDYAARDYRRERSSRAVGMCRNHASQL